MTDTRFTQASTQGAETSVNEHAHAYDERRSCYRTDENAQESSASNWRNPPLAIRIGLVAGVLMLPGILLGLMAMVVIPFTSDPVAAGFVGGVLSGTIGAWIESRD